MSPAGGSRSRVRRTAVAITSVRRVWRAERCGREARASSLRQKAAAAVAFTDGTWGLVGCSREPADIGAEHGYGGRRQARDSGSLPEALRLYLRQPLDCFARQSRNPRERKSRRYAATFLAACALDARGLLLQIAGVLHRRLHTRKIER